MGHKAATAVLAFAVGYNLATQTKVERGTKETRTYKHENDQWKTLSASAWVASHKDGFIYEDLTARDLHTLQDPKYIPSGRHAMISVWKRRSIDEAYVLLDKVLQAAPGDAVSKAHSRLQAAWSVSTKGSTPDLFVKVFNDLSTVLFAGLLHHRVYLVWEELCSPKLVGSCRPPSQKPDGVQRVTIRLNKMMIGSRHKSFIWGTLLHEMLHAYLNIVARRHIGYVSDHGPKFDCAAGKLVDRLRFPGLLCRHIVS